MISTLKHSGHPCDETYIYRRTRGGGRTQRKMHSARRALWRQFRVFGVDWELMDLREKIADIKHARRSTPKQKCKMNDVQERMTSNLKLKSSKIDKQPRLSVKPRLCISNIEAEMLQKKRTGSYQMKLKASSKSKASSVSPNFILRTSPDDVTHFFFPFTNFGKVASKKKLIRKQSSLSEEDIFCRKVRNFFYFQRLFRKRKKKIPRNGERRVGSSQNVFPQTHAKKRNLKLRKIRKKKKPAIKNERVYVQEPPLHEGPRYNISLKEVKKTYSRMRKGKGFFASNKVLWRNRHALVLGCSNFYRKVKDDDESYYQEDNKEYDVVEPPEPSPDPEVPTTGPQFSSDEAGDGPVNSNFADVKKNFQRNDDCRDSTIIVDKIIEESMRNISADLTEPNLLTLFKQLDGRDKIDELKKLISKLESMIEKGQGNICIRAMVRSKKK